MRKLLLVASFVLLGVHAALADCTNLPGQHVVLVSNGYDPDVLIWDSKQRLLDYQAGSYEIERLLISHAMFARAGTKALVTACNVNSVHPKYRFAPTDAVGVKVTSGPYRGRYGWVLVDDVRAAARRAAHAPKHH